MGHLEGVLGTLASGEAAALERLKTWLAMPSVGTDPAFDEHTRRAAEWCAGELRAAGFGVEIAETAPSGGRGQPAVFARSEAAPGYQGPRILFYGHYDVQPADPVELWESPPFEPVVRPAAGVVGERIVARGAVDDKGQVHCFLEAARAWHEATGLAAGGVPMTVLIEGEEESGSVNLERLVRERRAEIAACDVCLISDTGMLGRGRPAITTGIRGLVYAEVILHGPDQDLHSGAWGGGVPNPISELVKMLAGLWDADRRVTLPGFYDDVREVPAAELENWATLGVDEAAQLASIGLPPEAGVGEAGRSMLERLWARPTCDICGVVGGYTGAGAKTVIPSRASAKVSFRLVADQDPERVRDTFFAWVRERVPAGCRVELLDHGVGLPATLDAGSPHLAAAMDALRAASGVEPAMIRTGGSIPIAGLLKREVGLDTVFMGFGLDDDRVHSPNEKFELECWRLGMRAHAALVDELRRRGGLEG